MQHLCIFRPCYFVDVRESIHTLIPVTKSLFPVDKWIIPFFGMLQAQMTTFVTGFLTEIELRLLVSPYATATGHSRLMCQYLASSGGQPMAKFRKLPHDNNLDHLCKRQMPFTLLNPDLWKAIKLGTRFQSYSIFYK